MSDDRLPGIGHNRPPAPTAIEPRPPGIELRPTGGISCDWYETPTGIRRPRHFVKYWRLYRDGKMIDSFLTKTRAMKAMRRLMREAGDV